ncbi:MAG: hypothetical protein ACKKL6_01985 [Candidatus Komeilibacteria bacterium]
MNVYLDINGVLLTNNIQPAQNVVEFLKYLTDNHTVYWLTTHCRGGENRAVEYLSDKLPAEALVYLNKILPTDWDTLKTEAIDFTNKCVWFDDQSIRAEDKILAKHANTVKFIHVNLSVEPDLISYLSTFANISEK